MTKDQDRGNYAADVAVRASAERHASPVPPNFATDYQRDGKGFAIAEEDARNSVKGLKDRAPETAEIRPPDADSSHVGRTAGYRSPLVVAREVRDARRG